jgi:hypothetical protein
MIMAIHYHFQNHDVLLISVMTDHSSVNQSYLYKNTQIYYYSLTVAGDRRGHDRMVVRFTITYPISTYHC